MKDQEERQFALQKETLNKDMTAQLQAIKDERA